LALLLSGRTGIFEVFLNGQRASSARLLPWWLGKSRNPVEVPLPQQSGPVVLAIRVHYPAFDFSTVSGNLAAQIGSPTAVEQSLDLFRSHQLLRLSLSAAINLALTLAGIAMLLLFLARRGSLEYFWLGLYLLMVGTSFGLYSATVAGVLPGAVNDLYADPAIFLFTIAQIEFTYAFIRRKPSRIWRVYEAILLACLVATALHLAEVLPASAYFFIESAVVLPAACALPFVLLYWYRRGNGEAGWLILPTLFPAAGIIVTNLDPIFSPFGLNLIYLVTTARFWGLVPLTIYDLCDAIFLLAIGVVIFFRFTRVSREQARTSAELGAAREMQQTLVPIELPAIPGYSLDSIYLPAAEVGGDFYQVLQRADGSAIIVIGDVSGKGLKAAMTGTLALGALQSLAQDNLAPATMLERMNRQLALAGHGGFITCLCARITASGSVAIANAGHLAPYCNGQEVEVKNGLPLGLVHDAEYAETAFELLPGAMLTLISDGVVEARNPSGELFGFERTRAISTESAKKVAQAAQAFGQEDDITVLTLTRTGTTERSSAELSVPFFVQA
jgi:hypothetical protein